ncbi:MAG TPA: hypothetical protein V6D47_15770 [Oscillatoriaceae cyanobacterium]
MSFYRWHLVWMATAIVGCAPIANNVPSVTPTGVPAPAGATKLAPAIPNNPSWLTVSPDRRHIAYVTQMPVGQLHVVTLGGSDEAVSQVEDGISDLQWASDGQALVFQTGQSEIIPGQEEDWGIPKTEPISATLLCWYMGGGPPEPVLNTKASVWYETAPSGTKVLYAPGGPDASPDQLQVLDLDSMVTTSVTASRTSVVHVSPDGEALAWMVADGVQVLDWSSHKQLKLSGPPPADFFWLDADRLLVESFDENARVMSMRTFRRDGTLLTNVSIESKTPETIPLAGKGNGAGALSPDGKWSLGLGGSTRTGVPLISLSTGQVFYTHSAGWSAWLDANTLLGIFADGVYTMPLTQAADISVPSPRPS